MIVLCRVKPLARDLIRVVLVEHLRHALLQAAGEGALRNDVSVAVGIAAKCGAIAFNLDIVADGFQLELRSRS